MLKINEKKTSIFSLHAVPKQYQLSKQEMINMLLCVMLQLFPLTRLSLIKSIELKNLNSLDVY